MEVESSLAPIANDSWLEPVASVIEGRHQRYLDTLAEIETSSGSLVDHAAGHLYFGLHRTNQGWTHREWAPGAQSVALVGDFNHWNDQAHPLSKDQHGVWSIELPAETLSHGQKFKLHIHGEDGSFRHRIPAYASRVGQEPSRQNRYYLGKERLIPFTKKRRLYYTAAVFEKIEA